MTLQLPSEPCKCCNRYCYCFTIKLLNLTDLRLLIGFYQRSMVCQWSLSLETAVISQFLWKKKRNVKKISCYICSSTEEDNWVFFKDLDFYKYSYIKKELGNMVSSVFKENAWLKAHCSWMLKKAGSSKALLNDCQEPHTPTERWVFMIFAVLAVFSR